MIKAILEGLSINESHDWYNVTPERLETILSMLPCSNALRHISFLDFLKVTTNKKQIDRAGSLPE